MGQPRIYFDNAATTPILPKVIDRMLEIMSQHYGNPSSIHTEGRKARSIIEQARKTVAGVLNASIGEIFFTSGGTEANNTAIKCAVRDLGVRRIITSKLEHHCVLHSVEHISAECPVEVIYLENDETGRVSLDHLSSLLEPDSEVKTLVSVMHANNEIGTINDVEAIGRVCRQSGAFFHTDTVQTVGHLPIDVQSADIDFLSGAAHKFHGPKGIGFLYINGRQQIKPFIDGGAQERNMRGGTENIYGIAGLATALEEAHVHMEEHQHYLAGLKHYFRDALINEFPEIVFNGCAENSLETVLSVQFPEHPKNEMMLMLLDIHGISASGGSACSSGSEKGSHVLEAIGAKPGTKSIRFSFSHFNTREEVDRTLGILKSIRQAEAVFSV
jgi:cysteine desulfurase